MTVRGYVVIHHTSAKLHPRKHYISIQVRLISLTLRSLDILSSRALSISRHGYLQSKVKEQGARGGWGANYQGEGEVFETASQ